MSESNYRKEKDKILEIASRNGFSHEQINTLMENISHRIKEEENILIPEDRPRMTYRKFTFHPKFSYKFSRIFEKHGIKLAFNNRYSIGKQFSKKVSSEKPENEKPGIYRLDCLDCNKVYIGQTARSLKIRNSEHQRCIKNKEIERSAVAAHYWEEKHRIDNNPKLLKYINEKNRLNIWENMYIYEYQRFSFNTDLSGLSNPILKHLDMKEKFDNNGCNQQVGNVGESADQPISARTRSKKVNSHAEEGSRGALETRP